MGAIAGDVVGSIYEFFPTKEYDFPLFDDRMEYTDDSIMTIAIADWVLSDSHLSGQNLTERMRYWGRKYRYPMGGYGEIFSAWISRDDMPAYDSWGNGAAMRVSAVGWAFSTLEDTLHCAEQTAAVSHNHPEGIKGAKATAAAIFLARTGKSKNEIKQYITEQFGYDLERTCDDIREDYRFEPSCQETVPQCIVAFLDSSDYVDAIRLAISLGGDADTMGAITGGIASAFYKEIPDDVYDFAMGKLPDDLKEIVTRFEHKFCI